MHACYALRFSILVGLLATACAGAETEERDINAPSLLVTSPERGTRSSDGSIVVEGQVSDKESGIEAVTVSGVPATLDGSGGFRAEIALADGLNLLQVIATDQSGNQTSDTRALLSGTFAPAKESVRDAARVYIGQETLVAMADTSEAVLEGLDIQGLLASANPVLSKGSSSCLNATVDLEEVLYDDLQVTLDPVEGGIRARVQIEGLEARARAYHKVACLSGSTAIVLAADESEVEVEVQISVSGGKLLAHVQSSEAYFDNLSIDLGILPSSVIEFVVGELDSKLADRLSDVMAQELPPIVEENMVRLNVDHQVPLLGSELTIAVQPSQVDFDREGGTILLETSVSGAGTGTPYLSTPRPLPVRESQSGLSVAIADDALNQALSALWDSGALNRSVGLTSESGADLGGGILDRIQIRAPLPPVVGADSEDGSLKITVGDLAIDLLKEGEEEAVSRIALSLEMEVTVTAIDGQIRFRTEEPTLYMNRLDEAGFLTDRDLEILVAFASNMLSGDLNSLLGEVPLPSFEGTEIANAAVAATGGYLQVGADLVR